MVNSNILNPEVKWWMETRRSNFERKKKEKEVEKRGLCAEEAGRYVIAKSGLPLSATCRLSQGFRFVGAGHRTCSHRPPHPGRLASDERASTVTQASLKSHKISCSFSNSAGISFATYFEQEFTEQ